MGYEIEDEKTQAEAIAPAWDKPSEDVGLLVLRGPDAGRRFLVSRPGGVIGREPGAAVQLRDVNVSRRHALIEFGERRVTLSDLDSRNGVYVNGVQIARAEIFDGNDVQISNDTVMRVRFQDAAETELLRELQGAAIKDSVTGLANRRYVLDRLRQELSYGRRHGEPVSVGLIDIDDFKKVVDVDGQRGGDALLEQLAKLVRAHTRLEDVVGRYGDDELVVLLRNTGAAQAQRYAERLVEAVRARVYETGDVPVRASVTVGLATDHGSADEAAEPTSEQRQPLEPERVTLLLDRADRALYRGKSHGKDRVVAFAGEQAG